MVIFCEFREINEFREVKEYDRGKTTNGRYCGISHLSSLV
jgi:hypothetical protein